MRWSTRTLHLSGPGVPGRARAQRPWLDMVGPRLLERDGDIQPTHQPLVTDHRPSQGRRGQASL